MSRRGAASSGTGGVDPRAAHDAAAIAYPVVTMEQSGEPEKDDSDPAAQGSECRCCEIPKGGMPARRERRNPFQPARGMSSSYAAVIARLKVA